MIELLADNPLLLLFVVAAIGFPLGQVRIAGVHLGIAAVLFVGLALGALDPRLELPALFQTFGLVVFVYTIGLAGGRAFVDAFRRSGLRDNALALALVLGTGAVTALLARLVGLSGPLAVGLFCGSLTNTPALAAVVDAMGAAGATPARQALPVVGYSVAYPIAVIGGIVAIALGRRLFRVDLAAEAASLSDLGASGERLVHRTARVTRPDIGQRSLDAWRERQHWKLIFGKYQRGETAGLLVEGSFAQPGDLVGLVGVEKDLEGAVSFLGEPSPVALDLDHSQIDSRRIFVSNGELAGKTLAELRLPQTRGAMVTRIRRGDVDLLPTKDSRLELGDRVRVICRRERMDGVTRYFGDSYRRLSEIDGMSFGLGIALGLLLGLLPIPLPGGGRISLGMAGGPLVVALVLGALGRTGPITWLMPYSANLTLRQLGLIVFLAGVGTRSGHAFADTLAQGGVLPLVGGAVALTTTVSLAALGIGHRLLGIPYSLMMGIFAGTCTQPALLAYGTEQTGNDLPQVGYTSVFPVATVAKIVLAQLLLSLLG